MGYMSRSLVPGERIIAVTSLHWIGFVRPLFGWLVACVLLLTAMVCGGHHVIATVIGLASRRVTGDGRAILERNEPIQWIGAVCGVLGVVMLCWAVMSLLAAALRWYSSEFALTNKRVLLKTGVMGTQSLEIVLAKVESVYIQQSLLGRMFDFGSLVVVGSGGTADAYHAIESPMAFRHAIQEQIAGVVT